VGEEGDVPSVVGFAGSVGSATGRVTARLDRLSETRFALVSFVPGAVLLALFVVPPIVAVFGMSLFRIELGRDANTPFIGLRNFERLAADADFLRSVPRTLIFALATTLLSVPLSLGTALLLNRGLRWSALLGIAVLLPWAVAPVVTGLFWQFIFNSRFGIATGILTAIGLTDHPIPWLLDTGTAVAVAVIATAWRSVPLLAILLLAALRVIPSAHYRAARMDGATSFEAFRFVTLPAIRNTLILVAILQVILSLQVFDLLYLLTGGGPGSETTVMNYVIYNRVVLNSSFGYSAAEALVLLGVIVLCSSVFLYLRLRGRTPGSELVDDSDQRPWRGVAQGQGPGWEPAEASEAPAPDDDRHEAPRRRPLRLPAVVVRAAAAIAVALLFVWLLGPIAWMAISSIQPEGAITQAPPALTLDLTFDKYASLIADPNWIGSLAVSLQVSALTAFFAIVIGALAAYPLARYPLPGKGAVMAGLIFTQMIPAIVLTIPVFLLFQKLGLKDTVAALVLVNVAFWLPLIVWLLRNVFEDVPRALESAARMDGCSRLGTLFRITIPAASPGISAAAILLLIGTWNEFLFAVVLGDRNAVTMTRRISQIQVIGSGAGIPPFTLAAAAGILVALPCLLLVVAFHRRVIAGLTEGFVKG
jgi:ABC-type sugar transport system permease subunit